MFGLLRKKRPANALDEFIFLVYGNPPPAKRADVAEATRLVFEELLMRAVEVREICALTAELSGGPIPYSTHDLALSVALNLFQQPHRMVSLRHAQIPARLKMVEWVQAGLVASVIAKGFEDSLYRLYKPVTSAEPESEANVSEKTKAGYIEAMATVIGVQLELGHSDAAQASADAWVAGYIFGAHCSLLEHRGMNIADATSLRLVGQSYASLFPNPTTAVAAFRAIMSPEMREDPNAQSGWACARADVAEWLTSGKPTIGLWGRLLGGSSSVSHLPGL